jgi:hypothetical protein
MIRPRNDPRHPSLEIVIFLSLTWLVLASLVMLMLAGGGPGHDTGVGPAPGLP